MLLPVLASMLLLAACGGGGGGGGPASIAHFTAEGLAKGDGEWLLSWDATGNSVTLNGKSVARTGTQEVIAGEATTFTLRASAGDQGVSESVIIGPVSGISITDSAGRSSDFLMEVGDTLQLFARVQAEAADVEPNQDVIWESLDESVLRVSDTGLVTAVAAGTAQVHAVSRQWTGMRRGVAVTSQRVPRILEYVAIPSEAGDGAWTLSWSIDADTGTLNGEAVSAVGSRSVTPSAPTPYTLAASNGPDSVERTITVAPVDGISVQGLTVVGIDEEIDLSEHVTVQATGAAGATPSQAVTYRSGTGSVFTVAGSTLRAVATGTATLHITSVQDTRVTGSVEVTVVGAGLYELNADSAPAQLEAGESLLLEWRPVALSSL